MENNVKRVEIVAKRLLKAESEALGQLIDRIDDNFQKAVSILASCDGTVHVCGVGKSGIAAKKIAATLVSTGTASLFLHPTEAIHGDFGIIRSNDILISISNSGETDELLRLIPFLQTNQIRHIAMVGNPDATLSKVADVALDFSVSDEGSSLDLAPMASTIASIALGDALAAVLIELKEFDSSKYAHIHAGGHIGKKLHCTVKDIMQSSDLPSVNPNDPISEVVIRISSSMFGLVPVILSDGQINGVITDGDLRRGLQKYPNHDFFNLKARDLMTLNPKQIEPEVSILEAEKLMQRARITSLIVVKDQKMIGLLAKHQIDQLSS